jgi:hypothetical protein
MPLLIVQTALSNARHVQMQTPVLVVKVTEILRQTVAARLALTMMESVVNAKLVFLNAQLVQVPPLVRLVWEIELSQIIVPVRRDSMMMDQVQAVNLVFKNAVLV